MSGLDSQASQAVDSQGGEAITAAPQAARQAVLDGYLGWLEAPANQGRQITSTLFSGRGQGCCALGALGLILEEHGYARREGPRLGVFLEPLHPGGPQRVHTSGTLLPLSVLQALGLGEHHNVIVNDNDVLRRSFAWTAWQLRTQGVSAPADPEPEDPESAP